MAYTTITKSSDYFNTKLYTGNGGTQSITGVGFQPDWTWIKGRSNASYHRLTDAVRGVTKEIYSNDTSAEGTNANGLTAFGADGFSVGNSGDYNSNGWTFASWNWKAGNSAGSANTDGSQNTTVSANTTAGFSIVKWTGADSTASLGHGLGAVPKVIIAKRLAARNWTVYHASLGANKKLFLNTTSSERSEADFDAVPDASVFNVGYTDDVNGSGADYIAYCFAEKTGYSKFGSYTGNGSANGTFVYTGFKPNWVMIKETNGAGAWRIYDSQRPTYNDKYGLMADVTSVEETTTNRNKIDQLSNGFKLRMQYDDTNGSNGSYIYMAFGQSLVGSNNVACTAR